jgi:hypothetical protein
VTVPDAVRDALADVGAPYTERHVAEVVARLPVETTVEDVDAADPPEQSINGVVAGIRTAVRLRLTGDRPATAPRTRPAPVAPLPPPPPAEVGLAGVAAARAALAARQRPTDELPEPQEAP